MKKAQLGIFAKTVPALLTVMVAGVIGFRYLVSVEEGKQRKKMKIRQAEIRKKRKELEFEI